MPELPEVETVIRSLRPQLMGQRMGRVQFVGQPLRRPWKPAWSRACFGLCIQSIERRGKWILLNLTSDRCLIVHLGMTGRLLVADRRTQRPAHTHLLFDLPSDRQEMRFIDPRRFGSVTLSTQTERNRFLGRAGLGPEPWQLTDREWRQALRRSRRSLKAILLDQRIVAGLGNIYADESLHQARLSPLLRGCDVTQTQARRLRLAILIVLERAIQLHGSTIRNFYYGENETGDYQNEFRVYDRADQPCRCCRSTIRCMRLAGRSTHFCPQCQMKPKVAQRTS